MIVKDKYGYYVEVDTGYEETRERVVAALKEQSFGVLTEIDVKATLKKNLDAEVQPGIVGRPQLAEVAREVSDRLRKVLKAVDL